MKTLRTLLIAAVLVSACLTCSRHPARMDRVRMLMAGEDYEEALKEFESGGSSEGDVLFLLERGLLLHYTGQYQKSNDTFERAEILSEDLYTKSISREAAALVTSDLVLEYVPKPFEQVLINYFRALNYMFLGLKEDALVECRKAVDKLNLYSEEDKRPYRRDAFIEYLTGILYEWDGEINDALISYRNAIAGYETYGDRFGIREPTPLACDMVRTAEAVGFTEDVVSVAPETRKRCTPDSVLVGLAKIVVFIEQGFVPPKQELAANIPILKSEAGDADDHPFRYGLGIHSRIYGHTYDADDIAYFLRVAVPVYPGQPVAPAAPVLVVDSLPMTSELVEDVFAIAEAELKHDMPGVVAKALARALIKYKATDLAENKWGKLAGRIVNIATAASERADLRAWLSLPRAVYLATVYVEPGIHTISLGPTWSGQAASPQAVTLETYEGTTNFIRFRTYQ